MNIRTNVSYEHSGNKVLPHVTLFKNDYMVSTYYGEVHSWLNDLVKDVLSLTEEDIKKEIEIPKVKVLSFEKSKPEPTDNGN